MPADTDAIRERLKSTLEAVATEARASGLFEQVSLAGPDAPDHVLLTATAKDTPELVYYRLEILDGDLAVSWCSADRYISQSIETDVLWTGDDLDDLIDEELVDLGWERGRLKPLKHYRNDEMLFIFVSRLPLSPDRVTPDDAVDLSRAIMAYEHAFRELGDMSGDEEDPFAFGDQEK